MNENNVVEFCTSCGAKGTIDEIRRQRPGAKSCCPDRNVVDLFDYMYEHEQLKKKVENVTVCLMRSCLRI